MSTQEGPSHGPDLKQRAFKYSGLLAFGSSLLNLGLGSFLAWSWVRYHGQCSEAEWRLPVYVLISAIVAISVGGIFALYALVGAVRSLRRLDYHELEGDSSPSLLSAAKPGCCMSLSVVFLIFLYLFRLAWLIFGTVEVFSSSECPHSDLIQMAKIYVLFQWAVIGASIVALCGFCWIFLCCAAVMAKG